MEGGVEAGDLLETGPKRPDGPHRRQAARLVQRRQRRQRRQRLDDRIGDFDRTDKIASAVNDAMSDGQQRAAGEIVVAPVQDIGEQGLAVIAGRGATVLEQLVAGGVRSR